MFLNTPNSFVRKKVYLLPYLLYLATLHHLFSPFGFPFLVCLPPCPTDLKVQKLCISDWFLRSSLYT